MLDQWYRSLHIPMTVEQYHQFPRHSAFKYEYSDGQLWISPRPRTFNALLELKPRLALDAIEIAGDLVTIRPMQPGDWVRFPRLFAASFEQVPPFAQLSAAERQQAATQCLNQAKTGGDGPVLEQACFVANATNESLLGAIIITLIPKRDEGEWWDGNWDTPPVTEEARHLLGRPHLTWIFVAPMFVKRGLGSALLDHAVNALSAQGYQDLASTFLLGNDSTMLWHWRNEFRVLPYAGSMRKS